MECHFHQHPVSSPPPLRGYLFLTSATTANPTSPLLLHAPLFFFFYFYFIAASEDSNNSAVPARRLSRASSPAMTRGSKNFDSPPAFMASPEKQRSERANTSERKSSEFLVSECLLVSLPSSFFSSSFHPLTMQRVARELHGIT
jgi:hypothetical protein